MSEGEIAYEIAKRIFPICRSITGSGVRETLHILQEYLPELEIKEVPSGTQCFDWTVPNEWNINDAWVKDKHGKKIIDFSQSNLHVVGYSIPVHKKISLNELMSIIHTEPKQPDVIPYVTSYYKECYGFCISEKQKNQLIHNYAENDSFEIFIDSSLEKGFLTYGEFSTQKTSQKANKKEIFFSTYICHPSMANNECSGPSIAVLIASKIKQLIENGLLKKYNYRFIFIPETIGSILYLSKNLAYLKENMHAGFNLTCVGDDRTYSFVNTRYANTITDKILNNVLKFHYPNYKSYNFLERGSDERQYNAPGVDLPVCSFCRSLFHHYPEYHTSADNLDVITPSGLQGAFDVILKCVLALEYNKKYKINCLCEPQLGKRGLYPTTSHKGHYNSVKNLTNFLAYADGKNDLIDISNLINVPTNELIEIVNKLQHHNLISEA